MTSANYKGTHDFTGSTVSGVAIAYQTATGTTDINTASDTYVDVTDMSITVSTAGTYLVIGEMTAFIDKAGTGNANIKHAMRLYNSTTATTLHETQSGVLVTASSSGAQSASTNSIHWIGSLAASDVVKLQWRRTTGEGTIYNRVATLTDFRRMSIIRLA